MYKTSFRSGASSAADQYGVERPFEDEEEHRPTAHPPVHKSKSWLPALATGGLVAGGLYGFMRKPSFSKNPALATMQRRGAKDGFHRVVPVYYMHDKKPLVYSDGKKTHWLDKRREELTHYMTPYVDSTTHQLDWKNRLKMRLLHGPGSIPITEREIPDYGFKSYVPLPGGEGPRGGPVSTHVKGLVEGRVTNIDPRQKNLIQGGTDIEGNTETLRRHLKLDQGGKIKETQLLNKYAPGALPRTEAGIEKYMPSRQQGGRRLSEGARAQMLQRNIERGFPREGDGTFLIKPSNGLNSAGRFPFGTDDWKDSLQRYHTAMKDPEVLGPVRASLRDGTGDSISETLRPHDALEGFALEHALKHPKNMVLQEHLPFESEWRVHTNNGAVLPSLSAPRMNLSLIHI